MSGRSNGMPHPFTAEHVTLEEVVRATQDLLAHQGRDVKPHDALFAVSAFCARVGQAAMGKMVVIDLGNGHSLQVACVLNGGGRAS